MRRLGCFISLVQPGENAAGKNATTTFCLPLKSDSLIRFGSYFEILRSPTGANQARSKSGAGSPTLTDGVAGERLGGRRGGLRRHERGQGDEGSRPEDVGNRSTHNWSLLRRPVYQLGASRRTARLTRRRWPAPSPTCGGPLPPDTRRPRRSRRSRRRGGRRRQPCSQAGERIHDQADASAAVQPDALLRQPRRERRRMRTVLVAALDRVVGQEPRVAAAAQIGARGRPARDVRLVLIRHADGGPVERGRRGA